MIQFRSRRSQRIRTVAFSCAFLCTFFAPGMSGLAASHKQAIISGESEWIHAREVLLRYLHEQRVSVIGLYPTNHYSLGTSFWVDYGKGQDGLAIVRGQKIYIEKTNETISNLLKAEQVLERQRLTAADLLAVLHFFGGIPIESRTKNCEPVYFNPKIDYQNGAAVLRFAMVLQDNTCRNQTSTGVQARFTLMTVHIQSTYELKWDPPEQL